MKFRLLVEQDIDEMPEAQLDDIDPESAKLGQDVRLEPQGHGFKIEFRLYDIQKDGTIQQIEQQISAFGADVDVKQDEEGQTYSSLIIQKEFDSLNGVKQFLTDRFPIEQMGRYFQTNSNYMKVFVFNVNTPDEAVPLGPPAITDDTDARALLTLLAQQ